MPDHKKARLLIEEAGLVRMSGLDQAWHLLRLRSRTVHSRLARNVMQNGAYRLHERLASQTPGEVTDGTAGDADTVSYTHLTLPTICSV